MENQEKYVIICGTNRKDANSRKISQLYLDSLQSRGVDAEILDLKDLPQDFLFSSLYDQAGSNPDFQPFRAKIKASHKLIFVVPEYNGSFPGVLKAFIDGMEYPSGLKNKKAALVGLSSGIQGAGLALSHLTDILNYCGTHVLAQKPKLALIEKHFDGKNFSNPLYQQLIDEQLEAFVGF